MTDMTDAGGTKVSDLIIILVQLTTLKKIKSK